MGSEMCIRDRTKGAAVWWVAFLDGAAPAGEIAASTANRPGSAIACGG